MGIIILKILAILVPLLISIAYLTLAERKVLGYIQCRKGPNVSRCLWAIYNFSRWVKVIH